MTKSELIADLTAKVARLLEIQPQIDPVKSAAGINVYLAPFMVSENGVSKGENVVFYVYDEGEQTEKAEYDQRSFQRVFGGKVYSGSMADVKTRAVEIIGSADEAQAEAAYKAMVTETEITMLDDNWETELGVVSRLGMSVAVPLLETMKAAGLQLFQTDIIKRMIESQRGVNLADAQTIAFVDGLVAQGAVTQADADALLATNTETKPKWPDLQLWQVVEALRS